MSLKNSLSGTGVAVVTPFTEKGAVDFNALERVIDFVIEGGVNYIVTLGTTGETPTLEKEEKLEIIGFTKTKVNGRVPIVVGIGGNNTKNVVKDVEAYPLDGVTAVLSASPYYNKPSQEGIYQHYKAVATACPVPVILYNVPGRTGRNVEAATTIRIASEIENVQGIKEAGNNFEQCLQLKNQCPPDFLITSGDDDLAYRELEAGIDGVISVAANCYPAQFSAMVAAARNGDMEKSRMLNELLAPAYQLLFEENNPAGVKEYMAKMGHINHFCRLPVVPVSTDLAKRIDEFLKTSGL